MGSRAEQYCLVTVVIPVAAAMMLGGCKTQQTSPPSGAARSASDVQPLVAHARRLLEATDQLGVPLSAAERRRLDAAFQNADDAQASEQIQRVLDAHCLIHVHINPESRVMATRGSAQTDLIQNGWRPFLIKVNND